MPETAVAILLLSASFILFLFLFLFFCLFYCTSPFERTIRPFLLVWGLGQLLKVVFVSRGKTYRGIDKLIVTGDEAPTEE